MGIPGHLEGRSSPVLMPLSLYLNKRENLGRTVKEIPPTCSSMETAIRSNSGSIS